MGILVNPRDLKFGYKGKFHTVILTIGDAVRTPSTALEEPGVQALCTEAHGTPHFLGCQ